jgi:hypothetical protein
MIVEPFSTASLRFFLALSLLVLIFRAVPSKQKSLSSFEEKLYRFRIPCCGYLMTRIRFNGQ